MRLGLLHSQSGAKQTSLQMLQTIELIENLLSIYREKQPSETFLTGSLQLPPWITILSTFEIDQMIMPGLVEVFPEIVERWALSVCTDLTTSDLRSYLCLI